MSLCCLSAYTARLTYSALTKGWHRVDDEGDHDEAIFRKSPLNGDRLAYPSQTIEADRHTFVPSHAHQSSASQPGQCMPSPEPFPNLGISNDERLSPRPPPSLNSTDQLTDRRRRRNPTDHVSHL
ncbi:hypothetical protein EJ06DRAFT_346915 [Trichodelitschia bisporula]|uniref:Uncharacterized protein n=1 Tax=Trichodelitschia bisporula TaxID=703511 RepID=A0A6G1I2S4_9PEZI|nr:hypothetical protein EJ06DRAFT_346915 [Trichodelitschia bisporula]